MKNILLPLFLIQIFISAAFAASRVTPQIKAQEWKACHQNRKLQTFSAGDGSASIAGFLEQEKVLDTLDEMEKRKLLRAEVLVQPWSGDYWAYSSGLIAARYQNDQFNLNFDWLARYQFIKENSAAKIMAADGQDGVDFLSPAEKYDLLIGNSNSEFAMTMWKQGQSFYDAHGEVEDWMGICHGWAPASIVEQRPAKSIVLNSQDRKWKIHLLPSEIKGLVSYSWATNSYPMLALGSRCEQKDPKRDENGRLIDPRCQDMNPGTWHQVVVNMVGRQRRSFVMDATFDYEVWNQPVKAYSYVYFNKNTNEQSANFADALLKVQDLEKDAFAKYRSSKVKYVIGVEMNLSYVSETRANANPQDSEKDDSIVQVTYRYDLELDENHKIIGGEWESEAHPDFVWTPTKKASPASAYEAGISQSDWQDSSDEIPEAWTNQAQLASRSSRIFNSISKVLLKKSAN